MTGPGDTKTQPARARIVEETLRLVHHGEQSPETAGVRRNAAVTAATGVVLLVLLAVQGVTLLNLHALIIVHLVVGTLLVGPLAVKVASTGYRMLRYYAGAVSYRRKGPPHPLMRAMAPLLLLSTAVLMVSGIALAIVGPGNDRWLGTVHVASFWVWVVLAGVHVLVYVWRLPTLLAARRPKGHHSTGPRAGRVLPIAFNVAGLLAATMLVIALDPSIRAWTNWHHPH